MPLEVPTFEELQRISRTALEDYSGVSARDTGRLVRAILSGTNRAMATALEHLETRVLGQYLSLAVGQQLDELGGFFGLPRNGSTYATDLSKNNVTLSVDTNVVATAAELPALITDKDFSTIMADGIIVRAGLRMSTASGVYYYTTEDTAVRGAVVSFGTPVICAATGVAGNIGTHALSAHNLAIHQPEMVEIRDYILIDNAIAIASGTDIEDDDTYKYRLSKRFESFATSNRSSIELAALSVPGIRSVSIQEQARGVGTLSLLVRGTTPIVSLDLLAAVSAVVSQVKAAGLPVYITRPDYVGLKTTITLSFRPETSTNEEGRLRGVAQTILVDLINNYQMGAPFVATDMIQEARNVSPLIRDATIDDLAYGPYDPELGTITEEIPVLPSNINISAQEQWLSNSTLLTVC